MNFLKKSIITRLGTAMFAISLMALISMISSVIVAESTQGDAAGINLAGSLRMMSYRIVSETQQYESAPSNKALTRVLDSIDEFDIRINDTVLTDVIPEGKDHKLYQVYQSLMSEWQSVLSPRLKTELQKSPIDGAKNLEMLKDFVTRIDHMVRLLEHSTESKIKLLSLVQGISLLMTVIIIFIALYDIKCNVVEPLGELLHASKEASEGKLNARVYYQSDDELGLLGTTFNHMAGELSKIYADLENRVQQKTTELRDTNQRLQLLYKATRRFNQDEDICRRLMPVMKELEETLPIGPVSVTLCDPSQPSSYRLLTTQQEKRPADCMQTSCSDCIVPSLKNRPYKSANFPIQTREAYFGELTIAYALSSPLTEDQKTLIETLVDNLGTVLSLELKATQEQHMSLMEERAVIARELHDSLAQSLSYLKMQVGRLQILRKKQQSEQQIDDVVNELKEGLNSAYYQLRELLTTFRLTLDQPGLRPALESTVKEFSDRLNSEIKLKYNLLPQSLTANQEIHVLQLVREALANVIKHSQASEAEVRVTQNGNQMEVCVEDNGIGLPKDKDTSGHYGLVIMQDRSSTLNGELKVENRASSGTRVILTFSAKQT